MLWSLARWYNAGEVKYEEFIKLILLTVIYFLLIASYTLVHSIKDSIFMGIVGREYIPYAKMASMLVLIPPVLFYSYLVDMVRRYQLLAFCSGIFGILGMVFVYFIGHPSIGLINTDSSPYRLFGWLFYFFVEGYSPFLVSVFWAFSNSVYNPESAKKNYAFMVAGSKLGGILASGVGLFVLSLTNYHGERLFSDSFNHQMLVGLSSTLIFVVTILIFVLIRVVPDKYLHGYEEAYQFEKKQKEKKEEQVNMLWSGLISIWSGLKMFFKLPYLLGIFGMLFFYEVINTILSYLRLSLAERYSSDVSGLSQFLFWQFFLMHFFGFFISLLGTKTFLHRFGLRYCLLLIPILSAVLVSYFMFTYTAFSLSATFIALRSLHYAFSLPIRESLYIPTVKDVKFKSKSWIDAFGSKLAKTFGSIFNIIGNLLPIALFFPVHMVFFGIIIILWFLNAYVTGKRFERAIKNNEVIGA